MKTVLLIENNSRHSVALAHRFAAYRVRRVKYRAVTSHDMEGADIIVLSGGYPAVFHHYWFYRRQIELIRAANKPLIGICLGFELIVRAYGGSLYRLKRKLHGLREIDILLDTLGLGVPKLRVWEAHKWAVKSVPDGFKTVALSQYGVEIIQHAAKPIFGCQFHPEVAEPHNDGDKVLAAILADIDRSI